MGTAVWMDMGYAVWHGRTRYSSSEGWGYLAIGILCLFWCYHGVGTKLSTIDSIQLYVVVLLVSSVYSCPVKGRTRASCEDFLGLV